ncbi:MAG: reverse transcriptase domain-containing protein [Candidatus Thiodiazotropha taylori]|nr:hypothetical protein [Candidatus Thiodiazotropha taylori]MCW4284623.1 reverse transcriptase domain-containing protein [Candidatus Thiodiazotropha taylori]
MKTRETQGRHYINGSTQINDLKILSLNVCGLSSKLKCPEFIELINQYEIIGLQETKTDDADTYIELPGYTICFHNRTNISRYRSGGIVLLVKDTILPFIKIDHSRRSKLILFFTISKSIFDMGNACNIDDIRCGIVYIPPQCSKYAAEDPYLEIQEEIFRYCAESKNILLFGDFNSRCKDLCDYIQFDSYIADMHGMRELYEENHTLLNIFQQCNIPVSRKSVDKSTNSYGYQLLDMCRNNDLFLLNGRIGRDYINPGLTCKNRSTVDYFISTAYNLPVIQDICVHEFSSLFSDAHSPISLTLKVKCQAPMNDNGANTKSPTLNPWKSTKIDDFVDNIDILRVSEIEICLDKLMNTNNEDISKTDIDAVVNDISSLFIESSKSTFGYRTTSTKNNRYESKPWFNGECRRARNIYHKTRHMYNRYKTTFYKNILKMVSKNYKKTLSRNHTRFKNDKIKKLRTLKHTNPREYWKILNCNNKRSNHTEASIQDFYEYFQNLNDEHPVSEDDNGIDLNDGYVIDETAENELNQPITDDEVKSNVKMLKNNKAAGPDSVINEHIKTTVHIMLPVYTKLFNIILNSGIIPESWTIGIIKPIFKNKGDPKLPENYRPITLLSCFGKLFTSIINNRLQKFAEKYNVINASQAGFRKNYSTSDNLFILKSLIDIVQSQKKKLYCCFVDFKQAFDSVWRVGLWHKLISSGVKGKVFNLILNLYKNIKSQISTGTGTSDYFECHRGVRQGENLSPFLFTIFLNDLEHYLTSKHINGVKIDYNLDEASLYLKILLLLYADDTVIFSENADDLQHALIEFENYCELWKLKVNISKTKVVVFSRGKYDKSISFVFQKEKLETVEQYKYLGIYLGRSGSYVAAKNHIAEQGNKAMFALIRKIRSLSLPFDIQIELFEKTIKPILLYGCEVWGFGNLAMIERIQLKYFKYIFNLKQSTPSYMIYGELGIMPLLTDINARIISFWTRLIENIENHDKLSSEIYDIIYELYSTKNIKSNWIDNIKNVLCSLGFSGIWYSQSFFLIQNGLLMLLNKKLRISLYKIG